MKKEQADKLIRKVKRDYNRIADHFDQTRSHPWYEFKIYRELLSEGDKVLDLGCGNGRLLEFIDRRNVDYTGIDVSEDLLKLAKKKYRKKKLKSSYRFKKGSFFRLPYKRPWFDKIFSIASFHHIPSVDYRIKALKEMKRVLKKDGTLVISVWNLWRGKYRKYIWKSLFNLKMYDFKDCFIPWGDTGIERYYHAFSVFEMRSLLHEAGFFIVNEVYVKKDGLTEDFWVADNLLFIAKPIDE